MNEVVEQTLGSGVPIASKPCKEHKKTGSLILHHCTKGRPIWGQCSLLSSKCL